MFHEFSMTTYMAGFVVYVVTLNRGVRGLPAHTSPKLPAPSFLSRRIAVRSTSMSLKGMGSGSLGHALVSLQHRPSAVSAQKIHGVRQPHNSPLVKSYRHA